MGRIDQFDGITAFLAVARLRSFRAAARELGVTPGAISQAIRVLEERVRQPLFQRTTRTVALTEVGTALERRLSPAAKEIASALESLEGMTEEPQGCLRLTVPRTAVGLLIEPILESFRRRYPRVALDISANDRLVDLASNRYDAGIRMGEAIAKDMIAIRLTPNIKWQIVGAHDYFGRRSVPKAPNDLLCHEAIHCRKATYGEVYRWELVDSGKNIEIDVPAAITVDDASVAMALARKGHGLLYTADLLTKEETQTGQLLSVLTEYMPESPGLFLYFPAGSQHQPKLRAFINALCERIGISRVLAEQSP